MFSQRSFSNSPVNRHADLQIDVVVRRGGERGKAEPPKAGRLVARVWRGAGGVGKAVPVCAALGRAAKRVWRARRECASSADARQSVAAGAAQYGAAEAGVAEGSWVLGSCLLFKLGVREKDVVWTV